MRAISHGIAVRPEASLPQLMQGSCICVFPRGPKIPERFLGGRPGRPEAELRHFIQGATKRFLRGDKRGPKEARSQKRPQRGNVFTPFVLDLLLAQTGGLRSKCSVQHVCGCVFLEALLRPKRCCLELVGGGLPTHASAANRHSSPYQPDFVRRSLAFVFHRSSASSSLGERAIPMSLNVLTCSMCPEFEALRSSRSIGNLRARRPGGAIASVVTPRQ